MNTVLNNGNNGRKHGIIAWRKTGHDTVGKWEVLFSLKAQIKVMEAVFIMCLTQYGGAGCYDDVIILC